MLWNCNDLCGPGSYFGKVLDPVPAPVSVPAPDLFSTVFTNKTFVQDLAFSILKAALFPRKFQIFGLLYYILILYSERRKGKIAKEREMMRRRHLG